MTYNVFGGTLYLAQLQLQRDQYLPVWYRCDGMQVKGPMDYTNFDSYPKDVDIPPDELSGWDKDF